MSMSSDERSDKQSDNKNSTIITDNSIKTDYVKIVCVTFTEKYRGFDKDESVWFRTGVNLLVGDQGCGKSTCIQQVISHKGKCIDKKSVLTISKHSKMATVYTKDFEKDNPRIQSELTVPGVSSFTAGIMMRYMSHGQTVNVFHDALAKAEKGSIIIVDEPDLALSIRSVYKLIDTFKKLVDNDCQVIASIHNPLFLEAFPDILSLEHKKWMSSSDFMATQKS